MLISSNWFFLIKSISTENVQDAAMGYYISPIVSVALGYIIFKEKFSKIQFLSLILILIAMINLIVNIGSIPWIAISLATTWSLYGVIRKKVNIDSEVGLFFELSLLLPIFLGYSILLNQNGTGHFILDDKYTIFFLMVEKPYSRKCHCNSIFICSRNYLIIAFASSWLNYIFNSNF